MHVSVPTKPADRRDEIERVSRFVIDSIDAARAEPAPFLHLILDHVFPEDTYGAMTAALPEYSEYRPMFGRSKHTDAKGNSTRVKIHLFPEYVRRLPPHKREIWNVVGGVLRSRQVTDAFVRRLRPALERRFGANLAKTGFFPLPILTRDIPGYRIKPHTDTHWKGITVQLYLPRDSATRHIGTIFHQREPDGRLKKATQMQFVPNSGYAFAVGEDSWHSADPVGAEVESRDSILLTYFVDAGPWLVLRNRGKRIVNLVLNELRQGGA